MVVGGKLRGKEYILNEGENIIGRDTECDVCLSVAGVSKKHLSVTVTGDVAYIQDLGSSNGTFLNGKIIKRATAKSGDKIALPDLIIQVVYVKEKKKIIKKRAAQASEEIEDPYGELEVPENILAKLVHTFRFKVMKVVYGINEEYEWRVLLGIAMTVFIVVNVTLTIGPVLRDTQQVLLTETAKRGGFYAEVISDQNASALARRNLDQVDTGFLNNQDGVKSYELFDLEGRIVRPLERRNQYINDPFSVRVREWATDRSGTRTSDDVRTLLGNGEIGIGRVITTFNPSSGAREPVGIIAIRFAPQSITSEGVRNQKAYLEAIVIGIFIAVFFYGVVYFMTKRPIEELHHQIDEALRGRRKSLESIYLFDELRPLRNVINSLIQRNRELQNEGDDDFAEVEGDESYVASLKEFLRGAAGPAIVLDSEKKVKALNVEAEDLTGIRESTGLDMDLLDVCREQGFAATMIELCDNSANEGGASQDGSYEISGIEYNIFVSALMGRDQFAKAFFITFVKDS